VVLKPFGIPALLGLSLAITRPALPAAPDTVLYNGKIFTSVESRPFVRAVAIQGDRITAVGSDDEIEALADTRTRKINLRGHAVIPGINDAHNHLGIVPRNSVRLNFSARRSFLARSLSGARSC
jgi:predicted amidohydrolase YtcJ